MMLSKKITGIAIGLITATSICVAAAAGGGPFNHVFATVRGTNNSYSASLIMRTSYNNDLKYFSYDETNKYCNVSNSPVEYTLNWVNGNSNEFSIYTGSTYLDIDTSANKFSNSDTPVYWSMTAEGIGRTIDETTKYLYYNNSSPRCAPYTDKTGNTAYSLIFFYTDIQLKNIAVVNLQKLV